MSLLIKFRGKKISKSELTHRSAGRLASAWGPYPQLDSMWSKWWILQYSRGGRQVDKNVKKVTVQYKYVTLNGLEKKTWTRHTSFIRRLYRGRYIRKYPPYLPKWGGGIGRFQVRKKLSEKKKNSKIRKRKKQEYKGKKTRGISKLASRWPKELSFWRG